MSSTDQLTHPQRIAGYTYGTPDAAHSPVTLHELEQLKGTVGLTEEDERYLRMAGDILSDQASDMVDTWRGLAAAQPHLAPYSGTPDGSPNPDYAKASHPRFARWIIDACLRPYDQAWLDYQQEIGLRHTRDKKNRTDNADSAEHIPLRYLLAFTGPVITTTKDFLRRRGHSAAEVDKMHNAWTKAVLLHVTLWSRPYTDIANW